MDKLKADAVGGMSTDGVMGTIEVQAWQHEEDAARVISAIQKAQALRDGGASASSVKPYSVPLTRGVMACVQPKEWLWRVFNLGFPLGHEDSSNEWGNWNVIDHATAMRLAAEDDNGCYQFVPFIQDDPRRRTNGVGERPSMPTQEEWEAAGRGACPRCGALPGSVHEQSCPARGAKTPLEGRDG